MPGATPTNTPQIDLQSSPEHVNTLRDEKICAVCFAPGALVRTIKGWTPIEEIQAGEFVLTESGDFERVSQIFESEHTGVLLEINVGPSPEPIFVTDNHPFKALISKHKKCYPSHCERTQNFDENHKLDWICAKHLTKKTFIATNTLRHHIDKDFVEAPLQYQGAEVYLESLRKEIISLRQDDKTFSEIGKNLGISQTWASRLYKHEPKNVRNGPTKFELTPDFLWAIGLYLAEGSSGSRSINYALHRNEIAYQERLVNFWGKLGYNAKIIHREDKPNSAWVDVYSSTLAEWFPAWLGKGCENKAIPAELLNLPNEKVKWILRGVLDGDGAENYDSLKQTSRILALQVAEIGHRLRYTNAPTISFEDTPGKKRAYKVENAGGTMARVKKGSIKQSKYGKGKWVFDGRILHRLKSVKEIPYSGSVYNLGVEGDHTYTVQNILVHNCGSEMDGSSCGTCGFSPPPKSLDNPDLGKARENVHQNLTPGAPEVEGIQNPQQRALENPPPKQVQPYPPNFQANSSIIGDMNWEYYHPKLGMGKINPIEKPLQPNGPPATNQPRKEKIISNPQTPVTSNTTSTAASMIAAVEQKENEMSTKLADTARGDDAGSAPSAAKPDANVDVTGVGAVLDGSNEAASAADAQIETVGVGQSPAHSVEADEHQSLEGDAGFDGAGFNTDKTTDDSGPTKTWTINYGDGSDVLTQHDPVTSEPFPAADEGVKQSSQKTALDAEQFPHKEDGGFGGGVANPGAQPADPVGNAQDRVNVLEPATTPANNSGPTITWHGTDQHGHAVERQQEPVTKDEFPPASEGVKSSSMITSHVVKAMKLADLEIELGLANGADKYNRLAALGSIDERMIDTRLEALTQVKEAGLRRTPKTASALPSFRLASMASNETSSEVTVPDEALFL